MILDTRGIEVIDAHLHYGTDPVIADSLMVPGLRYDDPESVISTLDRYGVSKVVLLPPDRVLNPPSDFTYDEANEAVARAVAQYPGRVKGLMRLNPLFGAEFLHERISHFVKERKLSGVKLVARADFYRPNDTRVMAPLMEAAEYFDIPLLFHSGHPPRDLPSLQADLARRYPRVRVVIAHIGLHDYVSDAIIAAGKLDNVYCDMSQAWPYDIKAFVKKVGPHKLLFGTDGPFQSPAVELMKILDGGYSEDALRAIFNENAKAVWGPWGE